MTALATEAGAPAPAPSVEVADSLDDLCPRRKDVPRLVFTLPDAGTTMHLEAISPKEYGELNHAASKLEGDKVSFDNRLWNGRLIAMSLRKGDWSRMCKDEPAWRSAAIRIEDTWTVGDVRACGEACADLSRISKKARDKAEELAGKDSSEMETAG